MKNKYESNELDNAIMESGLSTSFIIREFKKRMRQDLTNYKIWYWRHRPIGTVPIPEMITLCEIIGVSPYKVRKDLADIRKALKA